VKNKGKALIFHKIRAKFLRAIFFRIQVQTLILILAKINISQEHVLKKLKLNTDKSAGLDGLHPKVLCEVI
jgi:hypothetical protein